MADKSPKSFHDVPWLARVISGVMGAFFVTGGLCFGLAWFSVGDWQLIVGMIFIVGLGADLLQGGDSRPLAYFGPTVAASLNG